MAYCDLCDRNFSSYDALSQHKRTSPRHDWCGSCEREFDTYASLRQHWLNSSLHNFCGFCNKDFKHEYQLDQHNNQCHEYCDPCNSWLDTADEMQDHDIEVHNFCVQCQQYFRSLNNLKNHLNSSRHVPKTIPCPGVGCGKKFISTAGLVLHLEAGTCVSGVTRQHVANTVTRLDRNHLITNPNRMITGSTESYQATQRAWNGHSYECYLCHKEFRTLIALNQHLASSIHEQAVYRCPTLGTGCKLKFKSLGHLFQHVENGSCGVGRFKVVQDGMDYMMQGMRRLAFH
ncbi:hypothetical protein FRC10_000694 [Ceratobasidium sp. 414]|nr:hypothetical protein FRC10_000694 [Ceratobasidium sp. 414]